MTNELAYLLGVLTGVILSPVLWFAVDRLLERATRRLDGVDGHVRRT